MKVEADAVVNHPWRSVFAAYRDQLPSLAEKIPHVESIETLERSESGGVICLVNRWQGAIPVPQLARRLVPMNLSWKDFARWDLNKKTAYWRIESELFPDAVLCHGRNRFVELSPGSSGEARTRIELTGEITVDLGRSRLVPDVIAKPIARAVEGLFVSQFSPSVGVFSAAIGEHLSTQVQTHFETTFVDSV